MPIQSIEVVLEVPPIDEIGRRLVTHARGLKRGVATDAGVDRVVDLPLVADAIADGDRSNLGDATDAHHDAQRGSIRRAQVAFGLEVDVALGGTHVDSVEARIVKRGDDRAQHARQSRHLERDGLGPDGAQREEFRRVAFGRRGPAALASCELDAKRQDLRQRRMIGVRFGVTELERPDLEDGRLRLLGQEQDLTNGRLRQEAEQDHDREPPARSARRRTESTAAKLGTKAGRPAHQSVLSCRARRESRGESAARSSGSGASCAPRRRAGSRSREGRIGAALRARRRSSTPRQAAGR